MGITEETRREAHEAIGEKRPARRRLLLEILGEREMTVDEIADELLRRGELREFDRNFIAPRLTELKEEGILEVVGKRRSRRTGRMTAVWHKKSRPGGETPEAATEKNKPGTVYTEKGEVVK